MVGGSDEPQGKSSPSVGRLVSEVDEFIAAWLSRGRLCGPHRLLPPSPSRPLSSPDKPKFHGLDHLRTLAIALVFFSHYRMGIYGQPAWTKEVGHFGWIGVDLFFVLSGFLIASQLFVAIRDTGTFSYRDFFLRRFFRIVPVFLVVLAIYFLVPAFRERAGLAPAWKFLTFTLNFGQDLRVAGAFSHAWSLCVEEHFYLVLPLLLLGLLHVGGFRRAWVLLPVLCVVGLMLRTYSWEQEYLPALSAPRSWAAWYQYVYYPTQHRLDGLLLGVGLAAICCYRPGAWARLTSFGNLWLLPALAALTWAYFLCYEEYTLEASVFGFPLVSLGFAFLVLAALSPGCFLYRWQSRATAFGAAVSYSFYLTHKGVIRVVQDALKMQQVDLKTNLVLIACLLASIIFAYGLRRWIEQPFLRLRDATLRDRPQSEAPAR
ncbi:MAG: acyltransferase [Verrucomicrobia bacterium]|nr:acyltransferase [Verrucomicrobiota bacterium]